MTMQPARGPRRDPAEDRLLVVEPGTGCIELHPFAALPSFFAPGDLLVVNDAATRPSSLLLTAPDGTDVEARLLDDKDGKYGAVLFGPGDWRVDTDRRPPPPRVIAGDALRARDGASGSAIVAEVSPLSPRLVRLALDAELARALFAVAAPVQYSYMADALTLADVQTPYASRPWAAEMPSAGRALRTSVLVALRRRGVEIARLTAAAGLSATGDPALDRLLPLPEAYEIPEETARAVAATRARGGAVIAVGTSTVRALESAVDADGALHGGAGIASLIIGPGFAPRVADGILSGMHEAGTSHDALLRAFAPSPVVDAAIEAGRRRGLFVHELGDHVLMRVLRRA